MPSLSITPSITVTIGRHTRQYGAFITTAPAALDAPATLTLHAATFADVAGFAAEAVPFTDERGRTAARLVLVEALEFTWQRARYRQHQHNLLQVDPVLVGLNTLQQWLWHRLQAPSTTEVAA
jgi:hypothetical protein